MEGEVVLHYDEIKERRIFIGKESRWKKAALVRWPFSLSAGQLICYSQFYIKGPNFISSIKRWILRFFIALLHTNTTCATLGWLKDLAYIRIVSWVPFPSWPQRGLGCQVKCWQCGPWHSDLLAHYCLSGMPPWLITWWPEFKSLSDEHLMFHLFRPRENDILHYYEYHFDNSC